MKKMKLERGKKPRKQRDAAENPQIGEEDSAPFLPSEIIMNILSRLPIRTTMSCKHVCKPWLNLLESREFVNSQISNSPPGLFVCMEGECPKPYKVVEFEDKLTPKPRVAARWNTSFDIKLPCNEPPYSSVDGLIFLCARGMMSHDIFRNERFVMWPRDLFICNPIARECIKLPSPPESEPTPEVDTFGFGVGRTSGEYKLVRVFHKYVLIKRPKSANIVEPDCQVYNVGSGSWGDIFSAGPFKYEGNSKGAFLNGNIHWLVRDMYSSSVWISCFDVETEQFSTISPPPCGDDGEKGVNLSILRDRLCLCDNSGCDEIVVWLMKRYGDEGSWRKAFVIRKRDADYNDGLVCPIKAFRNGDVLMSLEFEFTKLMMLYFLSKTGSLRLIDLFGLKSRFCIGGAAYAPTFLRLKRLAAAVSVEENVISF